MAFIFCGLHRPGCSRRKRIAAGAEGGSNKGESFAGSVVPFLLSVALAVAGGGEAAVVVDYQFVAVRVALTRHQYVGSGIFEHRNEKRQHVGLGVEILHRAENTAALPFPPAVAPVEVAAVALPQRYVGAVESGGRFRSVCARHELFLSSCRGDGRQRRHGESN